MNPDQDKSMDPSNDMKSDDGNILIVDDEIPNLQLLTQFLSAEGYRVRAAERPQLAIKSALAEPPSLILLDVRMPEMDGFEVCQRLKQDERTHDIPVIFVSALQDMQDRVRGFEVGGVDFISKPFQEAEVLARVRTHMDLRQMQVRLEELVAERTTELEAEIIERKHAGEALSASEAKYRNLVDNSIVGVFTTTYDGRFTFVNEALVGMFEFDNAAQMLDGGSLPLWDNPKDRERMLAALKEYGNVTNFEAETITRTGRYLDVLFSARLEGDSISGMVMDITERKQAEEARAQLSHDIGERLKELSCSYAISHSIRTRESLDDIFRDAVNAIPPGWHYPEITRGKLHFNENEWVSEPFEETAWRQSSDIVVNGEMCGRIEVYYLEQCPTLDEGPFMKEERNLIDGIARMLSEAIEHKIAEAGLREREATLETLLNAPLESMLLLSSDGIILSINEGGARRYGFTPHDLIGRNVFQLMPGDLAQSRMEHMEQVLSSGEPLHYEDEHAGAVFANSVYPIFDPDGERVINVAVFSTDITKSKQAEHKLKEYQQRLKSLAVQLTIAEEQERRRIAADLHDHVGQSLTLARLQLATARKGLPKNNKQDAQFDDMSQSLLQAIQDTRHLIFELSPPTLNELGLAAAIDEWMEEQIATRHGIKTEILDHSQAVTLGADLRAILFRNVRELLTNVIKHAQAKSISVWLEETADHLDITIQDDGVGFDFSEALRDVNVERGFGLFSIQERMTDLGGKLTIESQPGTGCRAVLHLPLNAQIPELHA